MKANEDMCFFCFDVLIDHLSKSGASLNKRAKHSQPPEIPSYECALFVSWKKYLNDEEQLRGCKGTHSVLPLHEGLRYYSICSATDDRRFESVTEHEVPDLYCTVSLLFSFETIEDCYDWTVGVHGLRIDFVDSRGHERCATFLPEVASDYDWTKKYTLSRLVQKSGCRDTNIFNDKDEPVGLRSLVVVRFQSSVASATYEEYQKRRNKDSLAENEEDTVDQKLSNKSEKDCGLEESLVNSDSKTVAKSIKVAEGK